MFNERRSHTSFIQVMYDVYWKDRVARVEAIAGTVFLSAFIFALVTAAANKQAESSTPSIIPTPSCLMDGRPSPSERTYSAKSLDGRSISSLSPLVTVFNARTCPPKPSASH
jgi:hypothetical protein